MPELWTPGMAGPLDQLDPDLGGLRKPEQGQWDVRDQQERGSEAEDVDRVDEDAARGGCH